MIDLGVILAGGQGRRLGGVDKASLMLGNATLHEIVADKLSGACRSLIVVAPDKPVWADSAGIRFIPDATSSGGKSLGPAGGLLGALRHLASYAPAGRLVTAPVDAPFFPETVAGILSGAIRDEPGAIVRANGRLQPVFGIWSAAVLADMERLVFGANERALYRIVESLRAAIVDVETGDGAFLNINTPEDLERARKLAKDE